MSDVESKEGASKNQLSENSARELSPKSHGVSQNPPLIRTLLIWIAGITAVLLAMASLFHSGQSAVAAASDFFTSVKNAFIPSTTLCNGDMTWEERVTCDRQKQ